MRYETDIKFCVYATVGNLCTQYNVVYQIFLYANFFSFRCTAGYDLSIYISGSTRKKERKRKNRKKTKIGGEKWMKRTINGLIMFQNMLTDKKKYNSNTIEEKRVYIHIFSALTSHLYTVVHWVSENYITQSILYIACIEKPCHDVCIQTSLKKYNFDGQIKKKIEPLNNRTQTIRNVCVL